MKNINKIHLIPLIQEGKIDEVILSIRNNNFDPSEISESGRGLLYVALLLKQYNIAEALVKYSKENNILFVLVRKKYNDNSIIDDVFYDIELLKGTYLFINKHSLEIKNKKFDFLRYCRELNDSLSNDKEALSYFKNICILNQHHITTLDQFKIIMELGYIGNKDLIEIYYDVSNFNSLPLNEHPSFKLLKDVCLNAPKYFDSHSYISSALKTRVHINKKEIINLENNFKNINDETSFIEYFKGEKNISDCISSIAYRKDNETSPFYRLEPNIEYFKVSTMLPKDTDSKLAIDYLIQWPTIYFDGKSSALKTNPIEQATEIKIRKIIKDYNLLGISFAKSIAPTEVVSILDEFISKVKKLCPIDDKYIGNNQLWLDFFSPAQTKRNEVINYQGYISPRNEGRMVISTRLDHGHHKCVSNLIHEYTHFLQLNNEQSEDITYNQKSNNVSLYSLKDESHKWCDFNEKDFSVFFVGKLNEDLCMPSLMKKHKEKLIETVMLLLDSPLEDFRPSFLSKINYIFKEEFDYAYERFGHILNNNLHLVDLYHQSQKNKDYSYEYYLWTHHDKHGNKPIEEKSKSLENYWNRPHEIHARLNQAITEQDNKSLVVNPKKLDAMKKMIEYFNSIYVDKLVENSNLPKKKKLKM
jgi:hypothetical protein